MAAGDAKSGIAAVAASGSTNIIPDSGQEWCVHNILHSKACSLYLTNGTLDVLIDSSGAAGGWTGYTFFLTTTYYIKVVNDDTVNTNNVGYTGVQTK